MNPKISDMLSKFGLDNIYFGAAEFKIFSQKELEEGQLGYSRHPDGSDLTGTNEGDWRQEWIAIGYDGTLGDPYFCDSSLKGMPVFTAMHGVGSWFANQISPSLENFLSSLAFLSSQSQEDACYIVPCKDTVTDETRLKTIESELSRINQDGEFWSEFIDRHIEWVEESAG